jgi:hypothetical protein
MQTPVIDGRYLRCPSCGKRRRRGRRALSRYRQHWTRKHGRKQPHPSVVSWL